MDIHQSGVISRYDTLVSAALLIVSLAQSSSAFGFEPFLTQSFLVKYPSWTQSCSACHTTDGIRNPRNPYGEDWTNNGKNYDAVAPFDSDGDEILNEVEILFDQRPGDASQYPQPPSGLAASDGTFSDKIAISWNSYALASNFVLYRATTVNGAKVLISSQAATSFDDTTALLDSTYYYFVKACNVAGCTGFSQAEGGLRTNATAPENVSASDGIYSNLVTVSWDAVAAATSYEVFRADSAAGAKTLLGSTTANTFDDDTVSVGTDYFYFLKTCVDLTCTDFSTADAGFGDPDSDQAKLIAADGESGDSFGVSVGISDSTTIIGAWTAQHSGVENAGAAYIFQGRAQTQKLLADAPEAGDWFGFAVDLDANTAVVGAFGDSTEATEFGGEGSVYVFTTADGVTWSRQQQLLADDPVGADGFGYAVAIDGDTMVVGAQQADGVVPGSEQSGAAYVFRRNGSSWTLEDKLGGDDSAGFDRFGWSVAISGASVVVGAWRDDDAGSSSGSAYLFVRGAGGWSQQQKLTASDAAGGAAFGKTVAIDGDTAVIGSSSGSAYVFVRVGTTWSEQQALTTGGRSVAMVGNQAVIGANGSVLRFGRSGSNWTLQDTLTAGVSDSNSFGAAVAMGPALLLVGSDSANGRAAGSGSASLFGELPNTLVVIKAGNGTGQVTSSPAGVSCGSDCSEVYGVDTVVTLVATAASGSVFAGWGGADDCTDGVVTMSTALTCEATFNDSQAGAVFSNGFEQ